MTTKDANRNFKENENSAIACVDLQTRQDPSGECLACLRFACANLRVSRFACANLDVSEAAVAPREAAELYALNVIAAAIGNDRNAETRYVVLAKRVRIPASLFTVCVCV